MENICSQYKPDSQEVSCIDWIHLGRFTDYRSIKLCQKTMKDYDKVDRPNWNGLSSYAFIMVDVESSNHYNQSLNDRTGLTLDDILYFKLRFKKQKNDRNFKIISYYKDIENPFIQSMQFLAW